MGAMNFDELVTQARNALDAIAKGDPNGYKELYADDEEITLGTPFGGFGKGRVAVHEQIGSSRAPARDRRGSA